MFTILSCTFKMLELFQQRIFASPTLPRRTYEGTNLSVPAITKRLVSRPSEYYGQVCDFYDLLPRGVRLSRSLPFGRPLSSSTDFQV